MAFAQQNLARGSLALVTDHHHVVTGALQKLGKHFSCLAGTIDAEHPLIGGQPLHCGAGSGGNIVQNLLQAGVLGVDEETLAIPDDRGLDWLIVGRPNRKGSRQRCISGFCRRCDRMGCARFGVAMDRLLPGIGFGV